MCLWYALKRELRMRPEPVLHFDHHRVQHVVGVESSSQIVSDGEPLISQKLSIFSHPYLRVLRAFESIPKVIEPSFNFGWISYSLLQYPFGRRKQDVARGALSLPTLVAPTKVLRVPF